MKIRNPFILSSYISPEWFCDRKKETTRTIDAVVNGRNLLIFSLRRLGKTQLIKHSFHLLEDKHNFSTVYFDILHTRNLNEFTQAFADAVFHSLETDTSSLLKKATKILSNLRVSLSLDSISGQPSLQLDIKDARESEATLSKIFEYLTTLKKNIVIAIDEFQKISVYPEDNVEELLRSFISNCPNVRFIFSGSSNHLLISMFDSASQPFYKSTEMMKLEKIEDKPYLDFIKRQFEKFDKSIDDTQITDLLIWCRSHTFYVQYAFNKLFSITDTVVSDQDITNVKLTILEENAPVYYSWSQLLTKVQWDLLTAIAAEGIISEVYSNFFITKHRLGSTSTVRTALRALLSRELVYESQAGYQVYDVFLSRWLERGK